MKYAGYSTPQAVEDVKISVAMATYNGELFLREQLESIIGQTLHPMELVVRDDGSTDSTPGILEDFARNAPFPVRILGNGENLGLADNFLTVASHCQGDWIAFCDQDDVWLPEKLEQCARAIISRDNLNIVLQNTELCDSLINRSGRVFPDIIKPGVYGPNAQYGFWCWLGCAQTIRGTLIREVDYTARPPSLNERDARQSHDLWTSMLSNAVGGVCVLPEPAVLYRRHAGALSGPYVRSTLRHRLDQARATGSAHYAYLSKVADESAATLRQLARSASKAEWSQRFLEGAQAFDHLSRIQSIRCALYSGAGLRERLRSYAALWRAGHYFGPRFVAMGWRSAAKDGLVAMFGHATNAPPRRAGIDRAH